MGQGQRKLHQAQLRGLVSFVCGQDWMRALAPECVPAALLRVSGMLPCLGTRRVGASPNVGGFAPLPGTTVAAADTGARGRTNHHEARFILVPCRGLEAAEAQRATCSLMRCLLRGRQRREQLAPAAAASLAS